MQLAALAYPGIDPVAFRLGPVAVHWYGLAYVVGFIAAYFAMRSLVRRWDINLTEDDMLNIVLGSIVGVIVGGRLGYVIFYGDGYYLTHPAEVFAIWDGGMSFHGGLAGILIAGVVMSRVMGVPWLTLCDLGALGAPVGFFFGRVANFINAELWGRVTDVPWAMVFPGAGPLPRHPSQLYEAALEGLALFVVVWLLSRAQPPRPRGELFGWFLAGYGVSRIAVEFFREPDTQLGFLAGGWLTMGMALSLPLVIGGVAVIVWSRRRGLPELGRPEVTAF